MNFRTQKGLQRTGGGFLFLSQMRPLKPGKVTPLVARRRAWAWGSWHSDPIACPLCGLSWQQGWCDGLLSQGTALLRLLSLKGCAPLSNIKTWNFLLSYQRPCGLDGSEITYFLTDMIDVKHYTRCRCTAVITYILQNEYVYIAEWSPRCLLTIHPSPHIVITFF